MSDSSGNARHGTYGAAVTLGAAGSITAEPSDDAVTLSGSSTSTATVSYASWMNVGNRTVIAAFRTTSTSSRMVFARQGGSNYNWGLYVNNGAPGFGTRSASGSNVAQSSVATYNDNQWHLIVGTYEGTTIRIYVDGVLRGSQAFSNGTSYTTTNGLQVGGRGQDYWVGDVDECVVLESALDGTAVANLYAAWADAGATINGGLISEANTVHAGSASTGTTVTAGLISETSALFAGVATAGAQVDGGIVTETSAVYAGTIIEGQVRVGGLITETTTLLPGVTSAGALAEGGIVSETTTVFAGSVVDGEVVVAGLITETTTLLPGDIDPGYSTAPRNWGSGRQRFGSATWEWSPAVEEPPAHLASSLPKSWVTALAFDEPTITNGRPVVAVTTATEERPRHRILIGGVDVTFLRGVPTPTMSYQLVQPGMYGPGSVVLPQVYGYMEKPGEGGLRWLKPFAPVVQQRVNAAGNVIGTDYKGFVLTYDIGDDGLRIECGGELTGRLALTEKQIPLYRRVRDLGKQVYHEVNSHGCVMGPVGGPDTGIEALVEGGINSLDAFNRLNAQSAKRDGTIRTTMPGPHGTYQFIEKDTTTIHATAYVHDGQLGGSLRRDLTAEPSRIYGTGVTPHGLRVLNGVYPGLAIYTKPAPYPMAGGLSFGPGTTNADTSTGDGITVMLTRLRHSGMLGEVEDNDGYDGEVADAIEEVQERAGILPTGIMDTLTWRALWDQDTVGYSMFGSTILPMAQRGYTRKWRRNASGAIIGRNPNYNPAIPPVDAQLDFGTAFRKPQMIRHAKRKLTDASSDNWVGTITLETGALIAGEHNPGDPITGIIHDREIRPGMNIWLPLFMGGIVVHVSGVDVNDKVTLQVDSRMRDTITVAQIIQRNREARRDLHATWIRNHLSSGNISDAITEFSEAGGLIDDVDLEGGRWNVFPVVSGRSGTVGRFRLKLEDATEFYVAVFGRGDGEGLEKKLERRIGDPSTGAGRDRWQDQDILDDLDQANLLLYVAGDPDDPCGYWPKKKSGAGSPPLTGVHQANAGFEYRTGPSNVLWVAVWPESNAKLRGGRIMWPLLEPM